MASRVIQAFFNGGRPRLPQQAGRLAPVAAGRAAVAQPHGGNGSFQVDPGTLGLASGGGRPLPDDVRHTMEAALGADFSGVRVHVGPQADRIGAIAFTVGSDIYFAPGRFQPDTVHGRQLLGHELAHVVQQRQGRVRAPAGSGLAVVQDHALEAEADRLGHRAAAQPFAMQPKMMAGPARSDGGGQLVQRREAKGHVRIGTRQGGHRPLAIPVRRMTNITIQAASASKKKWGVYADKLKYNNQTQFAQHVPDNSDTIKRALESQSILDAVYNPKKAFWLADPKQFKLASSAGKVMMVYTFSPEGARSLMEDALICGSGDFDADNPEPWVGEASHPNYTIWKTNELGAYGVGANRLKTLAPQVKKIQAFDAKNKEIVIKKK